MKNSTQNNTALFQALIRLSQNVKDPSNSQQSEEEARDLWEKIFQAAVKAKNQASFQAELRDKVGADAEKGITFEIGKTLSTIGNFISVVQEAKKNSTELKDSFKAWRESSDCHDAVEATDILIQIDASNPFKPLLEAISNAASGFRGELIARFEMYCESGWAARDFIESKSNVALTPSQMILRDAFSGKKVPPEELGVSGILCKRDFSIAAASGLQTGY